MLIGGKSARMGRDKGTLTYDDKPQAVRCHETLNECCEKAFISLSRDQSSSGVFNGFACIVDQESDLGPMGGLVSAMDEHPRVAWLALACDLPLVGKAILESLLLQRGPDSDATAYAAHDEQPEPLCAIYEPSCRAGLRACLEERRLSLRDFLRGADVTLVRPDDPELLTNVNTADEREAMLRTFHATRETTQ